MTDPIDKFFNNNMYFSLTRPQLEHMLKHAWEHQKDFYWPSQWEDFWQKFINQLEGKDKDHERDEI